MNAIHQFFRRYIFSTVKIFLLFFIVNIALFLLVMFAGYMSGPRDSLSVETLAAHVTENHGIWTADETAQSLLREYNGWGMLLSENGEVVWEQNVPEELPRSYTSADIASFSRWYLQGYPVKVWAQDDGTLMVAGFPQGTMIKYYYALEAPYLVAIIVGCIVIFFFNMALMIFLVLRNTRRVEKAMTPVLRGIQNLSQGRHQPLDEQGELAEISAGLNRAGSALMKKDNTRAEWIRGISHDIRTPLSIVLGYASELEDNSGLPAEARQQAMIIRRQAERLKSLVEDLNLTTKLEYALQPLHPEKADLAEICRQAVSETLNSGLPGRYDISFCELCPGQPVSLFADAALLQRLLDNLIRNSIVHNPGGCHILVTTEKKEGYCVCTVSDNGVGMDSRQISALNRQQDISSTCDPSVGSEHGLGLKLARQIVKAHRGILQFGQNSPSGLTVTIFLPSADTAPLS